MKKKQPAKGDAIVLSRICKLIPEHLVSKLARKHGIDKQARTFSPWSHVVSLIYAQLTHAVGLNDVCDGLAHHATKLATIRGATPPAKNTLSHANKTRDSDMMEEFLMAEADEAAVPVNIGFLGSHGVILETDGSAQGVDEGGEGMKKRVALRATQCGPQSRSP